MSCLHQWDSIVSLLKAAMQAMGVNPEQVRFFKTDCLELHLDDRSRVKIQKVNGSASEDPDSQRRASLEQIEEPSLTYQVLRWVPNFGDFQFFCESTSFDVIIQPTITALFAEKVNAAIHQVQAEWAKEDAAQDAIAGSELNALQLQPETPQAERSESNAVDALAELLGENPFNGTDESGENYWLY